MIENERCLLGCMMLNNGIVESVYNSLKPDAFSVSNNRMVYNAILKLRENGVIADITTLCGELRGKVDVAYIAELTDTVATSQNWSYYAENVKNQFLKSSLYNILTSTKDVIEKNKENTSFNSQDILNTVIQELTEMTKNVTGSKCYDMRELISEEIVYIQKCIENDKAWLGYDTGFEGLNTIINGLQSVFMVIGARPSMGKTALAQKMAMNISKTEKVVFIELEMSPRQLVERAISNITKIPFRRIQSGLLTSTNMDMLKAKMEELAENKNFIPCECPTRQLSDIVNISRNQVRNNGAKVIFIDHIGLIRCNYGGQSYEKARFISNTLQQLQRELNVPIVALSQLGRESEKGKSDLASFRGSGAIEEDADICIFINRDRAESEDQLEIPAEIVVAKNRDGAVGSVKMMFKPHIVDFVDLSTSYTETNRELAAKPIKPVDNKVEVGCSKTTLFDNDIEDNRYATSDYQENNEYEYEIF